MKKTRNFIIAFIVVALVFSLVQISVVPQNNKNLSIENRFTYFSIEDENSNQQSYEKVLLTKIKFPACTITVILNLQKGLRIAKSLIKECF